MTAPAFPQDESTAALARLFTRQTGQRLGEARQWRLDVALRPLQRRHGLATRADLVRTIEADPHGPVAHETIDALLNHETSFFRDAHLFDVLEQGVLPAIHSRKSAGSRTLHIWCAGAAQGQEPYSLAMILKRMGSMWDGWTIRLLATDVSAVAIQAASAGIFSQIEAQRGLPINELLRWFEPLDDAWIIHPDLRAMVTFRTGNVVEPAMVTVPFDLVLCRNVLLYFDEAARSSALRNLLASLSPDGYLMLGAGEAVKDQQLFRPSDRFRSIYVPAGRAASAVA